jgi:hypothetical protein
MGGNIKINVKQSGLEWIGFIWRSILTGGWLL